MGTEMVKKAVDLEKNERLTSAQTKRVI